jgi:hypothetical protein
MQPQIKMIQWQAKNNRKMEMTLRSSYSDECFLDEMEYTLTVTGVDLCLHYNDLERACYKFSEIEYLEDFFKDFVA